MKGRTRMMKAAGLLTLICSWSMAHGQQPQEQKLAQAMKQNQIALQQYTWKSQTQIRKEGEIKATKLFSNRYSANGDVVQLLIEEQSAKLPKFGIRGMVAKKKKEEAMELIDALQRFAKSYAELPPAKMQEFMKTAKVTLETNAPATTDRDQFELRREAGAHGDGVQGSAGWSNLRGAFSSRLSEGRVDLDDGKLWLRTDSK